MQRFLLQCFTILMTLSALGLGLWLANKNFPATSQLTVSATLGVDRPMLSSLGPPPRLTFDYPHQLILDTPVYFDLRSLPWFTRARVELRYREEGRTLMGLAGKVGEPWQYAPVKPLVVTVDEDNWQRAIFDVDLTSLMHPKNVRRFLIETAGPAGGALRLKSLDVTLQR